MKKFLIFLLLICLFSPQPLLAYADEGVSFVEYEVTSNSANVMSAPSFSSEVEKTLHIHDRIFLETEDDNPKEFLSGGFLFYKIKDGGYILANLVAKVSETLSQIPNFNAQTNAECPVYFLLDSDPSGIKLQKNQRIFLYKGYDKKSDMTPIAFLSDDGVLYGYVETKFVKPDGINPLLISCVTVIIAVLGVIFALLFMKRVKTKKIGTKN